MMFGIIGSIASKLVGSVSGVVGNVVDNLVNQFGKSNVGGALGNLVLKTLGGALGSLINSAPIPQFLKDAATKLIDGIVTKNQQATTPECQSAVNDNFHDIYINIAESTVINIGNEIKTKTGGNWLVALAGSLAGIQGEFLDQALGNMEDMKSLAGKKESSQEFLTAQSEYQSNMQMFNMVANASSTSIKSIGEGLTALARKQ